MRPAARREVQCTRNGGSGNAAPRRPWRLLCRLRKGGSFRRTGLGCLTNRELLQRTPFPGTPGRSVVDRGYLDRALEALAGCSCRRWTKWSSRCRCRRLASRQVIDPDSIEQVAAAQVRPTERGRKAGGR